MIDSKIPDRRRSNGGLQEYLDADAISSGDVRRVLKSPRHYKYGATTGKPSTSMRIGSAVHSFLNEPDLADARHPHFAGSRRYGRAWTEFLEAHPEVGADDVLIGSEAETVARIVDAVQLHARAREALQGGIAECNLFWTDEPTGLRCKARPDTLKPAEIVDLKTTRSRNFMHLDSHVARANWHVQLAHYAMGAKANGFPLSAIYIVVAESEPPHDVAVLRLQRELVLLGMETCRHALDVIAECERTNHWPGIDHGNVIEIAAPQLNEPAEGNPALRDTKTKETKEKTET